MFFIYKIWDAGRFASTLVGYGLMNVVGAVLKMTRIVRRRHVVDVYVDDNGKRQLVSRYHVDPAHIYREYPN